MKKIVFFLSVLILPILVSGQYEEVINNDVIIYGELKADSLYGLIKLKDSELEPSPTRGLFRYDYSIGKLLLGNGVSWDTIGSTSGPSFWSLDGDSIYSTIHYVIIDSAARIGDLPIITDDTYSLVADASGNIGYYGEEPTISLNLNTYLTEFGSSTSITASGSVTNTISATLSNSIVIDDNNSVSVPFTLVAGSYSQAMTVDFDPTDGGIESNLYTASIDWVAGSNSGTATASRTINGCYPYFYTVSATDYTGASGTTIYTNFTKVIEQEGTKSVVFNGTGNSYLVVPDSWGALTQVLDGNGFDVTASYLPGTSVTVSSSGLDTDYTNESFTMYRSSTSGSYSSVTYIFYF